MTNSASYEPEQPLSTKDPDDIDLRLNKILEETLHIYGVFETEDGMQRRCEALEEVQKMVNKWVQDVARAKSKITEDKTDEICGKMFTFGSFRLGVNTKGADIDVLVAAPVFVDRADFFGTFSKMLQEHKSVTKSVLVPNAFVPIIKLTFNGVELDVIFARLGLPSIAPELQLSDDSLLKNLDARCVRSLNGSRVTDSILELVPNKETFRLTLRTIKLWAKKHYVYGNSVGYLGGVSWAIAVAKVCQLYPRAIASTLVSKFFIVLQNWPWPRPIILKKVPTRTDMNFTVWDPTVNYLDRQHVMPIITPAFPPQNSTVNVTKSTFRVMMDAIVRASEIVKKIHSDELTWDDLFAPINFFSRYKHYLMVRISASTSDEFESWSGWIESKLRFLVQSLEMTPGISYVHLNPEKVKPKDGTPFTNIWFAGLVIANNTKNINIDTKNFKGRVASDQKENMVVDIEHLKRKKLKDLVPDDILKSGTKEPYDEKKKLPKEVAPANGPEPASNNVGKSPSRTNDSSRLSSAAAASSLEPSLEQPSSLELDDSNSGVERVILINESITSEPIPPAQDEDDDEKNVSGKRPSSPAGVEPPSKVRKSDPQQEDKNGISLEESSGSPHEDSSKVNDVSVGEVAESDKPPESPSRPRKTRASESETSDNAAKPFEMEVAGDELFDPTTTPMPKCEPTSAGKKSISVLMKPRDRV